MAYYTYVYLDPRKPCDLDVKSFHFDYEPIYIGKGAYAKRAFQHLGDKGQSIKAKKIQKIISSGFQPIIIKLQYFDSNEEASNLEIELIAVFGTIADVAGVKRGPLTNMTRGGDGVSGRRVSDKAMEVYKDRKGENNPFFGKHHTEEHIARRKAEYSGVNAPNYGITMSDATKKKISESKMGGETWNKGIERTDSEKEKISQKTKEAMNNPEIKQKIKDALTGRKRILKDSKRKCVKPEDLQSYIADGWVLAKITS